jgi:hypothetical protein
MWNGGRVTVRSKPKHAARNAICCNAKACRQVIVTARTQCAIHRRDRGQHDVTRPGASNAIAVCIKLAAMATIATDGRVRASTRRDDWMEVGSDDPSLDHGSSFAIASGHSGDADNGRAINL